MDFILHESAALSKEICDQYIKLFEDNKDAHHLGKVFYEGKSTHNKEWKNCKEIYFNEFIFYEPIQSCMNQSILKYREKYPCVDKLSRWMVDGCFKLQRYLPNEGYFMTHCENACLEDSNRVLVWMIYLNDVYDEGYTAFPSQDKKFQPRTGDLLIWPAYFTHTHHGVTSKTETKYILTGWFTYCEEGIHPWV